MATSRQSLWNKNHSKENNNHRKENESVCPSCRSNYSFFYKDTPKGFVARCPVILSCGHSICFVCLRSKSQKTSSITCYVCPTVSEIDNSKDLQELFPINVFAVGKIFVNMSGKSKENAIEFCKPKKKLAVGNSVLCFDCQNTTSDWYCRQCNTQFCSPCFDKAHRSVALQKHEKAAIEEQIIVSDEAFCLKPNHKKSIFEYYCETCSIYICDYCMKQEHLKHPCVSVSDKNNEILEEFMESCNGANGVLKNLYAVKKKLESTNVSSNDKTLIKIEKQVAEHFNHLHGVLQNVEENLLRDIKNARGQIRNSIDDVINQVDTNVKEVEDILCQSKYLLDENNFSNYPIFWLLEKLKDTSAMPCYLTQNKEEETTDIEFSTDPTCVDFLNDHCKLTLPNNSTIKLCSKNDLPEDMNIELLSTPKKPDKSTMSSSGSSLVSLPPEDNSSSNYFQSVLLRNRLSLQKPKESVPVSSSEADIQQICNIPPMTTGVSEHVFFCHLISPNSFYVQRKQAESILEKLTRHLSELEHKNRLPPKHIEPGSMYLVQFDKDKKWYRGIVKEVNETNTCQVFYIDYGNTETVHKSKLRDIPLQYANIPSQALHCSLHSCLPVKQQWTTDAINLVTSLTNGVDFSMYIENIKSNADQPDTYEVHLKSIDETILSVADVLIYLGHARLSDEASSEELMYKSLFTSSVKSVKSYFTDETYSKGDTFYAHISEINTPTNFYIQKATDGGKQLIQLMDDLKENYSKIGPNEKLVHSPVPGMPVAAKFKDGDWYRGVVLQIVRACYVQVQYVDFGNIECLEWTEIRTLHPRFLKKSIQAVKCALSDIAPKHEKGWSVPAKKAYENMVQKKCLYKVVVDKGEPGLLSIILYEAHRTKNTCFNWLLVKEGHAISVGPSSASEQCSGDAVDLPGADCTSTIYSVSKYQESIHNFSHGSIHQLPNLNGLDQMFTGLRINETNNGLEECSSNEVTRTRVKVTVLKVVNPGEVYITFPDLFKKVMEQTKLMTNFYNTTKEEDRSWAVGDLCAVLRLQDNRWHRGVIQSITSNSYKVFIKDIVDIVEVGQSGLRTLIKQFTSVSDGSFKCHLSGIIPPGGSGHWPNLTIEYIKYLAKESTSEYFIDQMGGLVNDSLPVQFWKKSLILTGALAPAKEEWTDISKELIRMGYALPDINSEHYLSTKQPMNSNPHQGITQWLQQTFEISAESPHVSDLEKEIASEKSASAGKSYFDSESLNSITDWIRPLPFYNLSFEAKPTYVDYEGAVYIQHPANKETLELIENELADKYEGSVAKPYDLLWTKGQICIALYTVENRWCRGKVLEVTPDQILVLFVDYGNTEIVQPENLRKQILLGDIPVQCHKCIVKGIPVTADGKWTLKELDLIHAHIVEKNCSVVLDPPSTSDGLYTIKSLISPVLTSQVPSGNLLDLIDLLVSERNAQPIFGFNEESERPLTFKELYIPDSLVELVVEFLDVPEIENIKFKITRCDNEEIMSYIKQFDKLQNMTIQQEARDLSIVTVPFKGLPCVGCFTEDDQWYRAIITNVDQRNDLATVYYVDFGNDEELPFNRLRHIKEEWLQVPMLCLQAKIYNVCKGPEYDELSYSTLISNCLSNPPYTMTIQARNPLQVELHNNDGNIAYQAAINCGQLKISNC